MPAPAKVHHIGPDIGREQGQGGQPGAEQDKQVQRDLPHRPAGQPQPLQPPRPPGTQQHGGQQSQQAEGEHLPQIIHKIAGRRGHGHSPLSCQFSWR